MAFEKPSLDMNRKPQAVLPRHLEEEKKNPKADLAGFSKKARRIVLAAGLIFLAAAAFIVVKKIGWPGGEESSKNEWYSVELVNGEIYFGRIKDISADPVKVADVYYDYDQEKNEKEKKNETSNLRLVKRGNETHGPSGEMEIVRSQILFMERLKPDSKVLKAILNYEETGK